MESLEFEWWSNRGKAIEGGDGKMEVEKIKQGLLNLLEKAITAKRRTSEDKKIELVIIHALDFIDDWTMETTGRELMNKYSGF